LVLLATIELYQGNPDVHATIQRAVDFAREQWPEDKLAAVQILLSRQLLLRDDLTGAKNVLLDVESIVRESGSAESLVGWYAHLATVNLWSGKATAAHSLAQAGLTLARNSGLSIGPIAFVAANAIIHLDSPQHAITLAQQGVQRCELDGDLPYLLRNKHVLGLATALAGDVEEAANTLVSAYYIEQSVGFADPGLYRWHSDLIEVLIMAKRHDEAREILANVTAQAEKLGRSSVIASLGRCAALLARTEQEQLELISEATTRLAKLPYPVELARSWGIRAGLLHRAGKATEAVAAIRHAEKIFRQYKATWSLAETEKARAAFARSVPQPTPAAAASELTDVELDILRLVCQGSTNRYVATQMYLSVKSVESALTRIYKKLGVRSRTQAAHVATQRNLI
jgi:DNA-binding CsgD family transcriptional regulator